MAATIGSIPEFSTTARWSTYETRLRNFLTANKITEADQQRAVLLTVIGDSALQTLLSLISPREPDELTFVELLAVLRNHFGEPQKATEATARLEFSRCRQTDGQTLEHFVTELRRIAADCNFGATLTERLRDQLIGGVRYDNTRREMLKLKGAANRTFERCYEVARDAEKLYADLKKFDQTNATPVSSSVHSVAGSSKRLPAATRSEKPVSQRLPSHNTTNFGTNAPQISNFSRPFAHYPPSQVCHRCGRGGHRQEDCNFRNQTCYNCGKLGHRASVCRSRSVATAQSKTTFTTRNKNAAHRVDEEEDDEEDDPEDESEPSYHVYKTRDVSPSFSVASKFSDDDPIFVNVTVKGVPVHMEFDTGSRHSLLSKTLWCKLGSPKLGPAPRLSAVGEVPIVTLGACDLEVKLGRFTKTLPCTFVDTPKLALFGRFWARSFGIPLVSPNNIINHLDSTISEAEYARRLSHDFPEIFVTDRLGTIKTFRAHLYIRPNAQFKLFKPRPISLAIKPKVDEALDGWQRQGIIEPVDRAEFGTTPLVIVPKPNGKVRVCGDFKVSLNHSVDVQQYPLPHIEELFTKLSGGRFFAKLDIAEAYMQLELDEESRRYVVLTTHRGLFKVNRMLFGLSPAVAIFQSVIERVLDGLDGVVAYLDDITVSGATKQQLDERLRQVLNRLRIHGLVLRQEKCVFFAEEIEYLGYRINRHGLQPSKKNIEAIITMPRPVDRQQLVAFLGMAQYYASHVPNMSSICGPLNELRKPDVDFKWTIERNSAFEKIKTELTSPRVLTHFQDRLPVVISADASKYGIGAVLSHVFPDGSEKVIRYASRSLSKAEQNYAQIEKEALSILFATRRFKRFVEGRKFILYTDHKPLLRILNPFMATNETTAQRLQRWSLELANFSYEIKFRDSKSHANADGLSRLPMGYSEAEDDRDSVDVHLIVEEKLRTLSITAEEVVRKTSMDSVLLRVVTFVQMGWPEHCPHESLRPFFFKRDGLTLQDGVLLWGTRVIVPSVMRADLLQQLHESHLGVVKMKSIARQYFWWPSIDDEIEQLARLCSSCAQLANDPPRAPLHCWELPEGPWQRIHLDFCGPLYGVRWLVWVDAYSKFAGVIPLKSAAGLELANHLTTLFATYGLPIQLHTDNGSEFRSVDYLNFCKNNNIRPSSSAPYHPQTNGEAERFVQTFKKAMKASESNGKSLNGRVQKFLFDYRVAIHQTTGRSPAEMMFGRRFRTRFDSLRPNLRERVARKQSYDKERYDQRTSDRAYEEGQSVFARFYIGAQRWRPGTIIRCTGPLSYDVQIGDEVHKRHVTQLRPNFTSLPSRSPDQELRLFDSLQQTLSDEQILTPSTEPITNEESTTTTVSPYTPNRQSARSLGTKTRPRSPPLEPPIRPHRERRFPKRFDQEYGSLGSNPT